MANEITFDKLPQAVGYLTEQVERIHKIVAGFQPRPLSTSIALSRLMRRAKSQEGEILSTHSTFFILLPLKNNTDTESSSIVKKMTEEKDLLLSEF